MAITTDIDKVRLEIGDVDATATITLADDEIDYALSTEANLWGACARCAELLSRRYLQKADVRLGRDLYLLYSTTAAQYTDMAKALRAKSMGTMLPYVGGRSISEKIARAQDADAVQPAFTKGMMRNPRAGGSTSDTVLGETDDDMAV